MIAKTDRPMNLRGAFDPTGVGGCILITWDILTTCCRVVCVTGTNRTANSGIDNNLKNNINNLCTKLDLHTRRKLERGSCCGVWCPGSARGESPRVRDPGLMPGFNVPTLGMTPG